MRQQKVFLRHVNFNLMHMWKEALLNSMVLIYMFRIALLVFASWNNSSALELNAWGADKLLHKHKEQFDYKQLNNFMIVPFILSGRVVYERAIGKIQMVLWHLGTWASSFSPPIYLAYLRSKNVNSCRIWKYMPVLLKYFKMRTKAIPNYHEWNPA